MGQVDVTEVLQDPEFCDPLVLIRRKVYVDQHGRNQFQEIGSNTFGSIQPVDGKTLQRVPESLRVESLMTFTIKGKIFSDGKGLYSDIIVHRGSRYAVKQVFDWTGWGEGFSRGVCVREAITL